VGGIYQQQVHLAITGVKGYGQEQSQICIHLFLQPQATDMCNSYVEYKDTLTSTYLYILIFLYLDHL